MTLNELAWLMVKEFLKNPVILFLFGVGIVGIIFYIFKKYLKKKEPHSPKR